MAKVKFGMMMTDASGKLGGQVFAKNRGGSYVRTKGIPTNPQTTAQMYIRGIFAAISSSWSTLTDAQRQTWKGFVNDYARTDIFGDLRNPSGKALFQRLNQNRVISEQAVVDVCGSPEEVPFAQLLDAVGSILNTTFVAGTNNDVTGSKVVIWATPQMSQGKSFVKNDLRQVQVFVGGNGADYDFYAKYVAKFGAPVAGSNVYVGLRVINTNGQASPLEVIKAVISA